MATLRIRLSEPMLALPIAVVIIKAKCLDVRLFLSQVPPSLSKPPHQVTVANLKNWVVPGRDRAGRVEPRLKCLNASFATSSPFMSFWPVDIRTIAAHVSASSGRGWERFCPNTQLCLQRNSYEPAAQFLDRAVKAENALIAESLAPM
jgi:hypothetical protein